MMRFEQPIHLIATHVNGSELYLGSGQRVFRCRVEGNAVVVKHIWECTNSVAVESVSKKPAGDDVFPSNESEKGAITHLILTPNTSLPLVILTAKTVVAPAQDEANEAKHTTKEIEFATTLSRLIFPKRLSAGVYHDGKIIVGDRHGDFYACDLSQQDSTYTLLGGHVSMLLDIRIAFHSQEAFIITCDRDEHIRVTSYPHTYRIQTFCYGHERYSQN